MPLEKALYIYHRNRRPCMMYLLLDADTYLLNVLVQFITYSLQ